MLDPSPNHPSLLFPWHYWGTAAIMTGYTPYPDIDYPCSDIWGGPATLTDCKARCDKHIQYRSVLAYLYFLFSQRPTVFKRTSTFMLRRVEWDYTLAGSKCIYSQVTLSSTAHRYAFLVSNVPPTICLL